MDADVLIRDVFGSRSFVERCSSRANWQACSDFILNGKHSAFSSSSLEMSVQGSRSSNSYWDVATRRPMINTGCKYLLQRTSKRDARSNLFHGIALMCIIVAITNVPVWRFPPFFVCLWKRAMKCLCLRRVWPSKRVSQNSGSSRAKVNGTRVTALMMMSLMWYDVTKGSHLQSHWLLPWATGKLTSSGSSKLELFLQEAVNIGPNMESTELFSDH